MPVVVVAVVVVDVVVAVAVVFSGYKLILVWNIFGDLSFILERKKTF